MAAYSRVGRDPADRCRRLAPLACAAFACAVLAVVALVAGCAARPLGLGSRPATSAPPAQTSPASKSAEVTGAAPGASVTASQPVGTTPATPSVAPTAAASAPTPRPRRGLPRTLDTRAILADTRRIAAFGVRRGGSVAEHEAAGYILGKLRGAGYAPKVQAFRLPGGQLSHNIWIVIPGTDSRRIVLSAHIDSRVPAPGANDDAVGCAALLALARAAKGRQPTPTIEIDFFGSEEFRDATPGAHHFGSRARVASLTRRQLRHVSGMITLDVIAVGSRLHTRTMGRGPLTMSNLLIRTARRQGVVMTYLRDPGATGWSDHERYEEAGVPVAWVERLTDPAYHTTRDTAWRLTARPIAQTMRIVLAAVNSLDVAGLNRLR